MKIEDTLQTFRAKSQTYYEVAEPWVREQLERILTEDVQAFVDFKITVASDHEDLHLLTDYHATFEAKRIAAVAFRGRDVERSKAYGHPVRQMTLRQSGARGHREYDKVLGLDWRGVRTGGGMGDFYVTVWCSGPTVQSGIIVDLQRLRTLPPDRLMRLEIPAKSNVPFVCFDAAALVANHVVRGAYPDEDFFLDFATPPMPGQGTLL